MFAWSCRATCQPSSNTPTPNHHHHHYEYSDPFGQVATRRTNQEASHQETELVATALVVRAEFQPVDKNVDKDLSSNDRGKKNCSGRIEGVKNELILPLPLQLESNRFKALEQKIYESDDFVGKQKYVDFSVGIHAINMYMTVYDKTLKGMYENRRVSFFNFFIILVRPQYQKFIIEEVVDRWRDALSSKNRDTTRTKFDEKWKNLGKHIREFMNTVWTKSEDIYNNR
jgi:hypothetical protein